MTLSAPTSEDTMHPDTDPHTESQPGRPDSGPTDPAGRTGIPGRRQLSGPTRALRMMAFEASMVFRQRNTMLATVLAPLFVLGFPIVAPPGDDASWIRLVAPMMVLVMVFSVYITAATVIASRRENQILKRMRTSEIGTIGLLVAMTAPLVVLGLVQVVIVQVGVLIMGGPAPEDFAMFALAAAGTSVLSVTSGVAIGSLSPNSERVQFTAMPLLLLAAIGSNLIVAPADPTMRSYLLFAPFTGLVDLLARAFGLPAEMLTQAPLPISAAGFDIAVTVFWIAGFAFLAAATWRWEPRR